MRIRPIQFKNALVDAAGTLAESYPLRRVLDAKTVGLEEFREHGAEGESRWTYGSEECVEITPPNCYGVLPKELADAVGSYTGGPQVVVELENVELLGETGLTRMSDGRYLLENSLRQTTWFVRQYLSSLASTDWAVSTAPEDRFEVAVSMVGPWSWGYYHWFAEYLTRIEGVERYESATGDRPTLLVPSNPPSWMRRTLELIGWDDYVEWPGGPVRVDRLVVPSVPYLYQAEEPSGHINSIATYRWVAERIADSVLGKKNEGAKTLTNEGSRIYVSRADADERHVVNESEIAPILSRYGIERHVMTEYSYQEQVRLFSNADFVLAPHGAGLINSIFASNLTIVELFGRYVNECYFTLADGMDFDYHSIVAEPVDENMRIDPDRLDGILQEVL